MRPLIKQCEDIIERFKLNKKLFDSGKNIEIAYPSSRLHSSTAFPFGVPLNVQRVEQMHLTGKYSDVDICIEGHGLVARTHKTILSLWSVPFTKVKLTSYFSFCLTAPHAHKWKILIIRKFEDKYYWVATDALILRSSAEGKIKKCQMN